MKINETAKAVHENAKAHGFFDTPKNIGEMLCLVHSEVSEALEADRKNHYAKDFDKRMAEIEYSYNTGITQQQKETDFKNVFSVLVKNSFEDELADIIIRVMDLAAFKGIDLEKHIELKMRYNVLREHKHGKKY